MTWNLPKCMKCRKSFQAAIPAQTCCSVACASHMGRFQEIADVRQALETRLQLAQRKDPK